MKSLTLFILFIMSLVSYNILAKTAVVVAKNSSVEMLEEYHVANIFLARTSRFPNGDKAIPIEFKGNQARLDFYQQIAGKTASQLNAYWTTMVFTGKGKPPRSYSTQEDLLAGLEGQVGTITYLPLELVTEDMKIVYAFE